MTWEDLVNKERASQDRKYGEQNHNPATWMLILLEQVGGLAQVVLAPFQPGGSNFSYKEQTEIELIHVGAVVKAMWESGVRQGWLKKR